MKQIDFIREKLNKKLHNPVLGAKDFIKYIGPGLLVTVGFIDPGNWASNIAAGSDYGYKLLWMVTLATIMLILLQHNAAHLGIATGDCLAETATKHLKPAVSKVILSTAVLASISTAMAEILGGAIALQMLFGIPIKLGAVMVLALVLWMLFSNSYQKLERWIIGFVSIIGLSFIFELSLVDISWADTAKGLVTPCFPSGSMPIIMAVLGAVVMPHNLFLHSEIIQSRQWNKENPEIIKRQLKYEFADTLFSMIIGWVINGSMIILAASTFFTKNLQVSELSQAQLLLEPLLGKAAAVVFGLALLFSGISSSTTAGMAGGSIVAGMYGEPYDIKDNHTKLGVAGILCLSTVVIFLVSDPFKGLVLSQMFLSIQLPITIFFQLYATSSKKIMGQYKNSRLDKYALLVVGLIVTALNIMLLSSYIFR
ncbi:MAG: Nramp family divalent metal transporter [Clostridiales bacterium]|nr:Nramp family divalent metal transporter [Clostridiales bacterium]